MAARPFRHLQITTLHPSALLPGIQKVKDGPFGSKSLILCSGCNYEQTVQEKLWKNSPRQTITPTLGVMEWTRNLTLKERGGCCHRFRNAILAVNGLEELWNAVVFIDNDNPHLRGIVEEGRRGGQRREVGMSFQPKGALHHT